MKWELDWNDPLTQYLEPFATLVGDRRTWVTLTETVQGVINSGSLICQQIAAHAPILATVQKGAQRVIRLVTGKSTKRSPNLDADHLTEQLRTQAVAQLRQTKPEALWVLADGSDLRKPHAKTMPHLMKVRSLTKTLVPGYRTLNAVGVTPGWRGILYHRLFSAMEPGFVSEPHETQQMLKTVSTALAERKPDLVVSWILDSGFDDIAVWRTIWEQDEHVVCRVAHPERLVQYQDSTGAWRTGTIADATRTAPVVTTIQTTMAVRMIGQPHAKPQPVTAQIAACPVRVTYETNVRRPGPGTTVTRTVWVTVVTLVGTDLDPWVLITDCEVTTAEQAIRIFQMYRQRWGVEDAFKFTKETLGWEEVQLLDLKGIRMLVALAWVAAGFLYQLGITLDDETVRVIAKLGGWEPRPNRPPGKITLTRGLRRLIDMRTTDAWLNAYYQRYGPFPPKMAAFLHDWQPDNEL